MQSLPVCVKFCYCEGFIFILNDLFRKDFHLTLASWKAFTVDIQVVITNSIIRGPSIMLSSTIAWIVTGLRLVNYSQLPRPLNRLIVLICPNRLKGDSTFIIGHILAASNQFRSKLVASLNGESVQLRMTWKPYLMSVPETHSMEIYSR